MVKRNIPVLYLKLRLRRAFLLVLTSRFRVLLFLRFIQVDLKLYISFLFSPKNKSVSIRRLMLLIINVYTFFPDFLTVWPTKPSYEKAKKKDEMLSIITAYRIVSARAIIIPCTYYQANFVIYCHSQMKYYRKLYFSRP